MIYYYWFIIYLQVYSCRIFNLNIGAPNSAIHWAILSLLSSSFDDIDALWGMVFKAESLSILNEGNHLALSHQCTIIDLHMEMAIFFYIARSDLLWTTNHAWFSCILKFPFCTLFRKMKYIKMLTSWFFCIFQV